MSAGHNKTSKIPTHRISRLAGIGKLGTKIAARTLLEGARKLSKGELPNPADLLMTPQNVAGITDELARMRGAALKLGQLISMDAGEFLPRELAEMMTRLRAGADFMPASQLNKVLSQEWGNDWKMHFAEFNTNPIAAASIGQVHRATHEDGRELAIKVQYPGVAQSIDSDIDNVVSLFRMTGFAPSRQTLEPLTAEAKKQLHDECDYRKEARYVNLFSQKMSGKAGFVLPAIQPELSTDKILAMSYVPGRSIETAETEDQDVRNSIFERLVGLALEEFFEFALIQTDPNFGNYTYDEKSGNIGLLDFGAVREIDQQTIELYRQLLKAGLDGDRKKLKALSLQLSFYSERTDMRHRQMIDRIIAYIFGAIRRDSHFDFANQTLLEDVQSIGMELATDKSFDDVPPADLMFLQRKAAGLYLLGRRLGANIPLRNMLEAFVYDRVAR